MVDKLKDTPCACCNKRYPAYAMQFHHIDPTTKYKDVAQLMVGKLDVLMNEIAKCVIVCANCHLGLERGALQL